MDIKFNILFNFYASDVGGGKKRLEDFSSFFNNYGGAFFIINENCSFLTNLYPKNKYFVFKKNNFLRLINENWYLNEILENNNLKFYFSYGIPTTKSLFDVSILHISNVLPFSNISNNLFNFKNYLLAERLKKSFKIIDYISAESEFSLNLIQCTKPKIWLPNSCDEILSFKNKSNHKDYAVIIGTQSYKCVDLSINLFHQINSNKKMDLFVVGANNKINNFQYSPNISYLGNLERNDVLSLIGSSRYYISSTKIENSHNSAMEGCYLSEKSIISDIPPHRELLTDFETFSFGSVKYLKATNKNISKKQLVTNEEICHILLRHFNYSV